MSYNSDYLFHFSPLLPSCKKCPINLPFSVTLSFCSFNPNIYQCTFYFLVFRHQAPVSKSAVFYSGFLVFHEFVNQFGIGVFPAGIWSIFSANCLYFPPDTRLAGHMVGVSVDTKHDLLPLWRNDGEV